MSVPGFSSLPAYIETSVIIGATSKDGNIEEITRLMLELRKARSKVYTSIITLQEASVLGFRRGGSGTDMYAEVARLARIVGVSREIAIEAARLEAGIRDLFKESAEQSEKKQRRRWDCFHLATARVLGCRAFYTLDGDFTTRQKQLGFRDLQMLKPSVSNPTLPF